MSSETHREAALSADLRRRILVRFGAPSFEDLGLPGGEVIDRGLIELAQGKESPESLVVSLAAPRLGREGAGRFKPPGPHLHKS